MMLLVRRDAPIVAEKMAVAMSPFSFTPSLQMPFFKDKGLRTDSFINGFSCHCACARLGKQCRRASGLCFSSLFYCIYLSSMYLGFFLENQIFGYLMI